MLGEMLELGGRGVELHSGLAASITENAVDLVFCAGRLYRGLWEALPSGRKGGYADTSAALEAEVLGAVRAGDAVMIKGSLGSRMAPLVEALRARFGPEQPGG